jgi:two-component system sensor histidine kinase/response regulator
MEANFIPDILIVDDIENNLFALRSLIEANFDANIIEASSGEQVLRIVSEQSVDLVLMDVMMPGMDGFETAKLIKNRPKTAHIPVIFISANDPTKKLQEKGIAAGGFDYLTKPIDDNQLVYRLSMYLRFIRHEFLMNLHLRDLNRKLTEEIEERKIAEETLRQSRADLQSSNSAKDKFFSIIAHDLKSPFNAILGLANLLLDDYDHIDRGQQLEFIDGIKVTAENTFKLLQNLLDWAQTQTGNIQFEPQPFYLQPLAADIVALVKASANNKNIALEAIIPEDIFVFADRNMVSTVIRNLLINAVKFSHPGGTITFSVKALPAMVEIRVSDNGVGISSEKLAKLFCLECNTVSYGTSGEEGTGLGLILCKEFVSRNGGELWVESQVGLGSHFFFTLPLFSVSN